MTLALIMLVIGAAFLLKGADWLVDGGAGIALKSGVSHLVVGLTITAFGTSAPELASSLVASLKGSGDICFGNVVGSNIANIALVLGVVPFIRPVQVNKTLARWEIPFLIFISILTYFIGFYLKAANYAVGIVFLTLFVFFMVHCIKSPPAEVDYDDDTTRRGYLKLVLLVVIGCVGLGFGGILFVNGASCIAHTLGVSEAVIGLTVVALGTSLPELITSAVAMAKGHSDISLGNIVGSNIFNILFVIGTTAVIHPYTISSDKYLTMISLPVMTGLAVLLLPLTLSGKNISRTKGVIFFLIYVVYCALAVVIS